MADPQLQELLSWGKSLGMKLDGVEFRFVEERAAYGLFATRDLRSGEIVMKTPFSTEISCLKIVRQECFNQALECFKLVDHPNLDYADDLLMITLVLERQKGEKSFHAPYINYLSKIDIKMGKMDVKMEDLPLSVHDNYRRLGDQKRRMINNVTLCVPQSCSQYVEWAFNVVHSRSFNFDENRSLSPFIDMINATQNPQTEVELRDWPDNRLQAKCFGKVAIKRGCTVKKGDQVFIGYERELTNMELWFKYGFVDSSNSNHQTLKMNIDEVVAILQAIDVLNAAVKGNSKTATIIENREISRFANIYFENLFKNYGESARGSRHMTSHEVKIEFVRKLREERLMRMENAMPELKFVWNDEVQLITDILQGL